MTFAHSTQQLGGAVQVRSSTKYCEYDGSCYYYSGVNPGERHEFDPQKGRFIPGTQFSILINRAPDVKYIQPVEANITFDFNQTVYATTYMDLAYALCANRDILTICFPEEILGSLNYSGSHQDEKDAAAEVWRHFFDGIFLEGMDRSYGDQTSDIQRKYVFQVYDCDLRPILQIVDGATYRLEPFCKGLLASKFFDQGSYDSEALNTSGTSSQKFRHCILLRNVSKAFGAVLSSSIRAIGERLSMTQTNVYLYPENNTGKGLPYYATTLYNLMRSLRIVPQAIPQDFPSVFPYALFLKNNDGDTLFEEEILRQAESSITDINMQGYKISNSHMRLGNKVHLDTFYEMAMFFENPNYAYYTAFLFAKNLIRNRELDSSKKVLFYSYSYNPSFCERHRRGYETSGAQRYKICYTVHGDLNKLPNPWK